MILMFLLVTPLLIIKAENLNLKDKAKLNFIRNKFYEAVESKQSTNELINYIKENFTDDEGKYPANILAYTGALETLKAKHAFDPYSKFKFVISGVKKLNKAVEILPDDLETRFLRFAVLHNIPGVFGVSDERNEDKNIIYELLLEKDYSNVSADLQKGIIEFMIESERLHSDQNDQLINLLSLYSQR